MYDKLFEVNYRDFVDFHKDVTKKFPLFPARVRAVKARGGATLDRTTTRMWIFKVASGTKPGVRYDVYVEFVGIPSVIRQFVKNKNNWIDEYLGVSMDSLANEVIQKSDLKIMCVCPADKFLGWQYIRTVQNAKHSRPETRPPDRRNPERRGFLCKHASLVLDELPKYRTQMKRFLDEFYIDVISRAEIEVSKKRKEVLADVDALAEES